MYHWDKVSLWLCGLLFGAWLLLVVKGCDSVIKLEGFQSQITKENLETVRTLPNDG